MYLALQPPFDALRIDGVARLFSLSRHTCRARTDLGVTGCEGVFQIGIRDERGVLSPLSLETYDHLWTSAGLLHSPSLHSCKGFLVTEEADTEKTRQPASFVLSQPHLTFPK